MRETSAGEYEAVLKRIEAARAELRYAEEQLARYCGNDLDLARKQMTATAEAYFKSQNAQTDHDMLDAARVLVRVHTVFSADDRVVALAAAVIKAPNG